MVMGKTLHKSGFVVEYVWENAEQTVVSKREPIFQKKRPLFRAPMGDCK